MCEKPIAAIAFATGSLRRAMIILRTRAALSKVVGWPVVASLMVGGTALRDRDVADEPLVVVRHPRALRAPVVGARTHGLLENASRDLFFAKRHASARAIGRSRARPPFVRLEMAL